MAAHRVIPTDLPEDLVAFLKRGGQLEYDYSQCEAGWVVLKTLDDLRVEEIFVSSWDTKYEEEDPNFPRGHYALRVVPLVAQCEPGYLAPNSVLLWFPHYREYGQWDEEHSNAIRFARVPWSRIAARPLRYLNAMWTLDLRCIRDVRPWRDGGADCRRGDAPLSSWRDRYKGPKDARE